VSADDQITLAALSHLTGSQFDRAFAENVVAAHRDAVAAFSLYAASGADPELRAFADRTLPKLRKMLSGAQDARNSSSGE
jgi:putative membrane protein